MSRGEGFAIADIKVTHLDDNRVRELWRRVGPDVALMSECMTLHLAVILESWGAGRRMTVGQAAPLWLPVRPEVVAHLVAVGMLDRTGRVPAKSWDKHFGPALERRGRRVEAGRSGGLASAKQRSSNASASLNPSIPSIHTNRSDPRPGARRGAPDAGPVSLKDAIAGTPFADELARRAGGDA